MKSEVDVGSQLIIATATATAVYCEAMPPPRVLEIARTIAVQDEEDHQLVRLQRLIETVSARNRQFLIESGERQAARNRKQVARKIKEAQLRKAAARLESEKRKATRRKSKLVSKISEIPRPTHTRSTTTGVSSSPKRESIRRSASHGDPGKSDAATPIVSNKQSVSGDSTGCVSIQAFSGRGASKDHQPYEEGTTPRASAS